MEQPTKARAQRVTVNLKVNLKLGSKEEFAERFAQNISRTGIFVRATDPVPVGSRVKFEYRLADSSRVLRGIGVVRWVRTAEQAIAEGEPAGMGIEFVDVDAETDALITQVVAQFGEGARAPRRARVITGPTALAPAESAAPATPARSLDQEEASALDALLGDMGGSAFGPEPEPGPDAPALEATSQDMGNEIEIPVPDTRGDEIDIPLHETSGDDIPLHDTASEDIDIPLHETPGDDIDIPLHETSGDEIDIPLHETPGDELEIPLDEAPAPVNELQGSFDEALAPSDGLDLSLEPAPSDALEIPLDESPGGSVDVEIPLDEAPALEVDVSLEETAAPSMDESAPADELADLDLALDASFDQAPTAPEPQPAYEDLDIPLDEPALEVSAPEPVASEPAETPVAANDGLWIDLGAEPLAMLVVEGGQPVAQALLETALPVPLSWFDDRWPHGRARIMARRLGMELVAEAEEPTLRTASGESLVIASALGEQLSAVLESHGEGRALRVILPHHAPGRAVVENLLPLAGAMQPQLVGEAEHAATDAVMVHIALGGIESRITLMVGSTAHPAVLLPDAGTLEAEHLLIAAASHALAREHGINVEEEPSLLADLQRQVAELRASRAEAPWEVAIAGAPVTLEAHELEQITRVPSERIALACEDLLRRHGVEPANLSALHIAGSSVPWPSLLEVLGTHLGMTPVVSSDHPWGRLAAAAKVDSNPEPFSPTTS